MLELARHYKFTILIDTSESMNVKIDNRTKLQIVLNCIVRLNSIFSSMDAELEKKIYNLEKSIKDKFRNYSEKKVKEMTKNELLKTGKTSNTIESINELQRIRNNLKTKSKYIDPKHIDHKRELNNKEFDKYKWFDKIKSLFNFKPDDDKHGVIAYTFSDKDNGTKCLRNINILNINKKIEKFSFTGQTYIVPAIEMMRKRYFKEQLNKANQGIPWSPIQLVIIFTDGELNDYDELVELLSCNEFEDVYILFATINESQSSGRYLYMNQFEGIQEKYSSRIQFYPLRRSGNEVNILINKLFSMAKINMSEILLIPIG